MTLSAFANHIAGAWAPAAGGATFESRSPADTDDLLGRFPASGETEALAAVEAAAAALPAWAARSPEERAGILEKTADVLLAGAEGLARELTREEGKTLAESMNEVRRTAANFRLYAGEALRITGETFPAEGSQIVLTLRQPVGVVVAITPWNFPLSIPARKIGPALAAGNTVVFKPSGLTPLMGQRLVEALLAAGLPPGVIGLVHGDGGIVGRALVTAPATAAISFTGSYEVGAAIHAAAGPGRRTQLEMGGKNPCIVLPDADPDKAVAIVMRGAFGLSGQACTGTSRVIAVGAAADALADRLARAAAAIKVGNGLEAGVQMGPVASSAQAERVLGYVAAGRKEGGRLLHGGERLTGEAFDRGFYVSPAVFADVPEGGRLSREEVFGPLLVVQGARDLDEALAMANAVEFGLAAAIVTSDLGRAVDFARRVEAGVVKVNSPTTGVALNAPFGGMKHSSNQVYKEQAGAGVMDFYTFAKTVYLSA